MYKVVSREQIVETVAHLRELYRAVTPSNAQEERAQDMREIVAKNLTSNLFRTKEHPTLHAVLEIADVFALTLDGAHRLFGYDLDSIREFDNRFSGGRTHIVESYPFERDLLIELPQKLGGSKGFGSIATLPHLVSEWQTKVPIGALDEEGWRQQGAFYVQVGTEDSIGSSLPPGALALVEPVREEEQRRPNPRSIYLLQFGNGYRCGRCVVTRGKLLLLVSGKDYTGPQEFAYPGSVRIAGRVRMFALELPLDESPLRRSLTSSQFNAPLILPWEHRSLDQLFATEYLRFQRGRTDLPEIREALEAVFRSRMSGRTERRYRRPTPSHPHVDALIQLTLLHTARYTDSLRAMRSFRSDRKRFSLQTLLKAERLRDLPIPSARARAPIPIESWIEIRKDFVEWPPSLSMKFPQLRKLEDQVVRFPKGSSIKGLDPPVTPGSMMLLQEVKGISDTLRDEKKTGWARSIYALRRGTELFMGYLERDGTQFALRTGNSENEFTVTFVNHEFSRLRRVVGVAVPV